MVSENLLIVDRHPIFQDGLKHILEEERYFRAIFIASDTRDGLKIAEKISIDHLILTIEPHHFTALQSLDEYSKLRPRCKITVLSDSIEESFVYKVLCKGAQVYILKNSSAEEVIEAINYIEHGSYWISSYFSQDILKKFLIHGNEICSLKTCFDQLTLREKQIFHYLVQGHPTKKISNKLFIDKNTVAKHRSSIFLKLQVENLVELTRYAIKNKLTDLP